MIVLLIFVDGRYRIWREIGVAESIVKDVENDWKICYYEIYAASAHVRGVLCIVTTKEEINYEYIG